MAGYHQRPNQNPPSPQSPQRSSYDGSSYVHKQRMYQQQRSIAGFEDEQAVKDANDVASKTGAFVGDDGQQKGLGVTVRHTQQQHRNTVSVAPDIANDHVPVSPMKSDSVIQPDVEPSPMKKQSPVKQQAEVAPSSSPKPAHTERYSKSARRHTNPFVFAQCPKFSLAQQDPNSSRLHDRQDPWFPATFENDTFPDICPRQRSE